MWRGQPRTPGGAARATAAPPGQGPLQGSHGRGPLQPTKPKALNTA